MKSVIVACFCHKSCCLPYVRSLASSETVCKGHASPLTVTFHKVCVVTCLRCDGIFNNSFIANLLESVPVKEFLKLVNIW